MSGDTTHVLLRERVKLEPLAFGWYTWPHLLTPVQHALNMAHRHIPMLQSFLANPSVHVAATKDPAMLGAPFIDAGLSQIGAVRTLLEETQARGRALLDFARALREYNTRLLATATGYSLDGEYDRLPPCLQGLTELVYDTNNLPRIRFFEELAYRRAELDDTAGQSIRLADIGDAERGFFLTSPRLPMAGALELNVPFTDPVIDVLASLRQSAMPRGEIAERLGLTTAQRAVMDTFLVEERAPAVRPDFTEPGVRLRYFGHACVLVQSRECSVLVDPLTAWERQPGAFCLTFTDLPEKIDYAVLSHCHMDHCCAEMILQLRRRVGRWIVPRNNRGELADPSMKLLLRRLGCTDITVVDPLDSIELPEGEILSLPFPGEHCGLDIASKQSFRIRLCGRSFLFLVDSDAVDGALYARNDCFEGRADALFIGMECYGSPLSWFYGPLLGKTVGRRDDESRRGNASSCERAWRAIAPLDCDQVYVYAMGNERWNRYLLGLEYDENSIQIVESNRFVERCRSAAKRAERLYQCREMYFTPQ